MKKFLLLCGLLLFILTISGCPEDPPPEERTVTEVTTDNDAINLAQDLGDLDARIIINGSTVDEYDIDFYTFNSEGKSSVSITVTWTLTPAANLLDLYFYNSAQEEIASAATEDTGGEALTNQAVSVNSVYYFDLSGFGAATGDYTVTIE